MPTKHLPVRRARHSAHVAQTRDPPCTSPTHPAVHCMARLPAALAQLVLCAPQARMGRYKGVGMPRAKKNKVEKVEALLSEPPVIEMDLAAAEERVSSMSETQQQVQATAERAVSQDGDGMTGEEARLALDDVLKTARAGARDWEKIAKQAESDYLLAHRLHKAKMERWDRAEDRKPPPSAYKQIEKYYKNMLELERARAKRLAVLCCAARAQSDQLNCHVEVQAIEIARLNGLVPTDKKSKLRRLTVSVQH